MAEPLVHTYPCFVRWSDVDAYGHVNNVKYFEYFQEARLRFIAESGARVDTGAFVVARIRVDYRRPLFYRSEPYVVRSRIIRLGRSSYDISAEICDGDEVLASSTGVVVAYDREAKRSRPLQPVEREAMQRYLH